jgi:hypothetical protein
MVGGKEKDCRFDGATAWVDFNDAVIDGKLTTLLKFIHSESEIHAGDVVVASDPSSKMWCLAKIGAIMASGFVILQLDMKLDPVTGSFGPRWL